MRERPERALFFMLKIRKTTKSGGLKALESLAKEADGLCADVGITSKSNTKRDNVSMAQIAQWQERFQLLGLKN